MVDGITILGLLFGLIGISMGGYSLIKQRNFEIRIKEKENLKILSKQLEKDIIPWIDTVIYSIKGPFVDDLDFKIHSLGQEILSNAFDEQKDIVNIEAHVNGSIKSKQGKEEERWQSKNIDLEDKEDIIKHLEECTLDHIDIWCTLGGGTLGYNLDDAIQWLTKFYYEIIDLEVEFGTFIDEFKPELINSTKKCIKEIFTTLLISSINSKNLEINIKSFTKTNSMGIWVYDQVIGRAELDSCLDKLLQLEAEFNKLRETLIMTSYT